MVKINRHIEIVRSSVSSLSSLGRKSCDMILDTLKHYYIDVGVSIVNNESDLLELIAKRPDLVFLGVKNIPAGEQSAANIWIAEYLDNHRINYTGSNAHAIAYDFNKPAAKQAVKAANLNTADYFVARPGQYHGAQELPINFPLFAKPPNAGGGKGIDADSVIRDFSAFERKVQSISRRFNTPSLVEDYLPGREFSVAILEIINSDKLIVMPIELVAEQNSHGDRMLGQTIKAADTETVIAVDDQVIKNAVMNLAVKVFRALGARDYGRVDIRLDAHGIPHFLEANLIPGLAQHDFISYFTRACWINERMDYESMILRITQLGLSHDQVTLDQLHESSDPYFSAQSAPDTAFSFV